MKILYLNPVGAVGGAERVLLGLLSELRRQVPEWELHLWTGTPGPLLDRAAALGIRVRCIEMPRELSQAGDSGIHERPGLHLARLAFGAPCIGFRGLKYARALRQEARALAPDVIHSNGIKMHLLSVALPQRRLLWHLHDFVSARPLAGRAMRVLARRGVCMVAVSAAVAQDAKFVFRNVPLEVVRNGLHVAEFSSEGILAAPLDALAGMDSAPPEVVRIGLVGSYAKWKGHDLFLRSAARALERLPNVPLRFYVVGGPVYETRASQWSRDELEDLARTLGIANHVGFIPFTLDVAPIYQALDVVVHASTRPEPFGMTIAEGMASGRAVVAVASGGAAELLSRGGGVPLPEANEERMAQAICRLAVDKELRGELGSRARRIASQEFSSARMAQELISIYREL